MDIIYSFLEYGLEFICSNFYLKLHFVIQIIFINCSKFGVFLQKSEPLTTLSWVKYNMIKNLSMKSKNDFDKENIHICTTGRFKRIF